jgi:glycosyltransferase involved in cell wall biosynthesis
MKGIGILLQPLYIKNKLNKIKDLNDFDIILYESPPISNMSIVKWLKKKTKAKTYLMLKDIFPQNAIDLKIIKNKTIIHRYFRKKEKKLYDVSDIIGCMSASNMKYLLSHNNLNSDKVKYFPNTKAINSYSANYDFKLTREKYGIPLNSTVFIFGGNMGKPQYMELHQKAIVHFNNNNKIFFIFVGRGTERYIIEETIKNNSINNVLLLSEIHRDEYEKLVLASDVGLVTLNPLFTIPNFPSRILSYMEYSKPILAATDLNTDIGKIITEGKFGYWCESSDAKDFNNLLKLMCDFDLNKKMGSNALEYMNQNFNVKNTFITIAKHFI